MKINTAEQGQWVRHMSLACSQVDGEMQVRKQSPRSLLHASTLLHLEAPRVACTHLFQIKTTCMIIVDNLPQEPCTGRRWRTSFAYYLPPTFPASMCRGRCSEYHDCIFKFGRCSRCSQFAYACFLHVFYVCKTKASLCTDLLKDIVSILE